MTEPRAASRLGDAGFTNVRVELAMSGLVLYAGERTGVKEVAGRAAWSR